MKIEITQQDYKNAKYESNNEFIALTEHNSIIVTYKSWKLIRMLIAQELLRHDPEYTEITIYKGKFRFRYEPIKDYSNIPKELIYKFGYMNEYTFTDKENKKPLKPKTLPKQIGIYLNNEKIPRIKVLVSDFIK